MSLSARFIILHTNLGTTVDSEIKREIESLSAETLAHSATLIHVLGRLIESNPKLWIPISLGFDDAARHIEDHAIKLGETSSPDHAVKAIRIVEAAADRNDWQSRTAETRRLARLGPEF